jgi:hypothetical protein
MNQPFHTLVSLTMNQEPSSRRISWESSFGWFGSYTSIQVAALLHPTARTWCPSRSHQPSWYRQIGIALPALREESKSACAWSSFVFWPLQAAANLFHV